jgi:hypothetical protein
MTRRRKYAIGTPKSGGPRDNQFSKQSGHPGQCRHGGLSRPSGRPLSDVTMVQCPAASEIGSDARSPSPPPGNKATDHIGGPTELLKLRIAARATRFPSQTNGEWTLASSSTCTAASSARHGTSAMQREMKIDRRRTARKSSTPERASSHSSPRGWALCGSAPASEAGQTQ